MFEGIDSEIWLLKLYFSDLSILLFQILSCTIMYPVSCYISNKEALFREKIKKLYGRWIMTVTNSNQHTKFVMQNKKIILVA